MNRRNVEMFSGDSVLVNVTVRLRNGSLADLTGGAFTYKVARTPKSEILLTKTNGDGIIVTGPGALQIQLDPPDTSDLVGDDYYHELRSTGASGAVTTLMYGTLTVNEDLA